MSSYVRGGACYAWAAPALWWIKISAGAQASSHFAWTPRQLREVEILSQLFSNHTLARDSQKGFVAHNRKRSDVHPSPLPVRQYDTARQRDTALCRSRFYRFSRFVGSPISAARTPLGTTPTALRRSSGGLSGYRHDDRSDLCRLERSEKTLCAPTVCAPTVSPITTLYGGRSFVVWPAILYNRSL